MISALRVGVAMTLLLTAVASNVAAQSRSDTLLVVVESGPNSMDIHGVGANRPEIGRASCRERV